MRVATLNVWGLGGDWQERRRGLLRDGFAALAPDLVTLQETIVGDGYDQVGEILGDGFQVVHQDRREPDGQGVSTASRWPVGEVIELDQRSSDAFAATSLIVEVLAPDGRVWLVNHFPTTSSTTPPSGSGRRSRPPGLWRTCWPGVRVT
jgi:exonuclease III